MALAWADVKTGDIIEADDINNIAHAITDVETGVTTAQTAAQTAQAAANNAKTTADDKADKVAANGGFVAGDSASIGDEGGGAAIGYQASASYSGGAVGNNASANSGFAGGQYAKSTGNGAAVGANASTNHGGAVGLDATSTNGFAGGNGASTENGGAIGSGASANNGGAIGASSFAIRGGAVGDGAKAQNGFAGGKGAICGSDSTHFDVDCIQLGTGLNSTEKTLQVYNYLLLDAEGQIPATRMQTAVDDIEDIQNQIDEIENTSAQLYVVSDLPSTTAEYDFSDGVSKFVTSYRTACSVVEDTDNGGYYQKITNSGNSNTYRTAVFDCSDIFANADTATVEFDAKFASRWHLSLADLTQRPGTSSGSTIDTAGCAFTVGTKDGSKLTVVGADGTVAFDGWTHFKIVLDFAAKQANYTITSNITSDVLKTGTVSFPDTDLTAVTGFEAYTWSTGDLLVDNIRIVAVVGARENARYLVKTDNGYEEYQYIDNEPIKITAASSDDYKAVTGELSDLTTTKKSNLVAAINEIDTELDKSYVQWKDIPAAESQMISEEVSDCNMATTMGVWVNGFAVDMNNSPDQNNALLVVWSDEFAGMYQTALTGNGIYQRLYSSQKEWGEWKKIDNTIAQYNSSNLTASETLRGRMILDTSGDSDAVKICVKSSSGTYEWKTLTLS